MREGEMNYSLLLKSILLRITALVCYRSFSFPLPSRKGDRCKEHSLSIYEAPRQSREQREMQREASLCLRRLSCEEKHTGLRKKEKIKRINLGQLKQYFFFPCLSAIFKQLSYTFASLSFV